jgi:hypothetical protein
MGLPIVATRGLTVAYGLGVFFRMIAVSVVLLVLAGGVYLTLQGRDALTAFGDRLQNPPTTSDGHDGKRDRIKAKRKICSTLDDAERLDLIGVATPVRLLNVEGALDPYTCRWAVRRYRTVTAFVEVMAAPADAWAVEMRGQLALTSMDLGQKARLLDLLRKPDVTRAAGCRFARALFEMSGALRGAERTVTRSTAAGGTPSVSAQSCVDGMYYAVIVAAPGLRTDDSLLTRAAADLRAVERQFA